MTVQLMSTHSAYQHAVRHAISDTTLIWSNVRSTAKLISYHLYSIWLFTLSDLKTIIVPSTAFAVLHKFGSPSYGINVDNDNIGSEVIQVAVVAGWAWINLLPFAIDNQRQDKGIDEDRYNKPWRPLPSARMTTKQAAILMTCLYPMALVASIRLGVFVQSLTLVVLGVWYNDFDGADISWLVRNFINACGFICYTSGALQVVLQRSIFNNTTLVGWFAIIGGIVFTSVQTQDMYDQVGDSQRGRKTAPLVLGDGLARWTIALPVLFWSCLCPRYWSLPIAGYVPSILLGFTIAFRSLKYRSVSQDKTTFRLWNLWLVGLYSLPLLRSRFL